MFSFFKLNIGETYECVREDRGFRYVSEQVSHHPPVSTCHAFSEDGSWRWWQDFRVKTKFWGKVLHTLILNENERFFFFGINILGSL